MVIQLYCLEMVLRIPKSYFGILYFVHAWVTSLPAQSGIVVEKVSMVSWSQFAFCIINEIIHCSFAVTLGFFDDILIPPTALQHPSRFEEEAEPAWVWEYPLEDGAKHDLYMYIGEPIKFRVTGDIFEESSPIGPPNNDKPSSSSQSDIKTPYRIVVRFSFIFPTKRLWNRSIELRFKSTQFK